MNTPIELRPWSLADLFPSPDSEELKEAFDTLETQLRGIEQQREKLSAAITADEFCSVIHDLETMTDISSRIQRYAYLLSLSNFEDSVAESLYERATAVVTDAGARVVFFQLWWAQLDDETADRLQSLAGENRYWLERVREERAHYLDESGEAQARNESIEIADLVRKYEARTAHYRFQLVLDGEPRELSTQDMAFLQRHSSREVRAGAWKEYLRVFGEDSNYTGELYRQLVRLHHRYAVIWRGYASLEAAFASQVDIPQSVIEAVLQACDANTAIYQRFLKLVGRRRGRRLSRYDLLAGPRIQVGEPDFKRDWLTVIESLLAFDTRLAKFATDIQRRDHIDSEARQGKPGVSECVSVVPGIVPWVLVNYDSTVDGIQRIVHEVGHAVHHMAYAGQSPLVFEPSLLVGETVALFAELLLLDGLPPERWAKEARADVLIDRLMPVVAGMMVQYFLLSFERKAHEILLGDRGIDEVADVYMNVLREQFGHVVDVPDEFRWEWLHYPHLFRLPFYVFTYIFGQLAALLLHADWMRCGDDARKRILSLMGGGGSAPTVKLFRRAGIDIEDPATWTEGFRIIQGMIDELGLVMT